MTRRRGQAIVEFAAILVVFIPVFLLAMEVGWVVFISKPHQDRATEVIAEWAAGHPGESWNSVAANELPGCDVTVSEPFPDLIEARSTCQDEGHVIPGRPSFPISSRETSTKPPSNGASQSPSPSDSSPSSSTARPGSIVA